MIFLDERACGANKVGPMMGIAVHSESQIWSVLKWKWCWWCRSVKILLSLASFVFYMKTALYMLSIRLRPKLRLSSARCVLSMGMAYTWVCTVVIKVGLLKNYYIKLFKMAMCRLSILYLLCLKRISFCKSLSLSFSVICVSKESLFQSLSLPLCNMYKYINK